MLSILPETRILKNVKTIAATIFIAIVVSVVTPLVARATVPVNTTDNLLQHVGGTVYINKNIDWEHCTQYYSNGSWHNISDLKPANPSTQDGTPADMDGGWKIRWDHLYYKGVFMVYRAPDNGKVTYAGSTWPGFKLRFNNIGYTTSGESIDSIVEFHQVHAWQFDGPGLKEPEFVGLFHIGDRFGPAAAAVALKHINSSQYDSSTPYDTAVQSSFTTTLVKSGTDTQLPSDTEFDVTYWDIDQPVHHSQTHGIPRIFDFKHPNREGMGLGAGYSSALIGDKSTLKVSDESGVTWLRSGKQDDSKVPDDISTVVAKAGSKFTTYWTGEGCETGLGYDSTVTVYPEWPDPVKSPERQIHERGEIATFDVTEKFPYVADSNKASYIEMSDTLDKALDASKATVQVLKKGVNDTDYTDVTDNWTISVSGQTVTAVAKNTGHGYAEGEHIFRITAPVSESTDLGQYETEEIDGKTYWKVPNRASVRVNSNTSITNTVHVFVPYKAKGTARFEAVKKLEGGALKEGQFTFTLKDSSGTVIDTQKNDASGGVTFKEIPYTQEDIGKTYTYTIEEVPGSELGYTYDTHKETVTVEVKDNKDGTLNIVTTYASGFPVFKNKYQPLVPLTVIKKSTDGTLLAGAEFTLYKDDGNGTFDANDQPATIYSDKELTKLIPGAVVTTDASGEAHYFGLVPGTTYWLKETKAPTGYNLDATVHMISVSSDGKISTKDSSGTTAALPLKDGVASITIADEPIPALPLTAGAGVAGLLAIGSILIAGGGGIALFRRRN